MSRSRANQHLHVAEPTQDAQREYLTVQCDLFFMEAGKEDAVVAFLMVDTWPRYVSVVLLKPRNTQTVGKAVVKCLNEVDRAEKVELAGDNEPSLRQVCSFANQHGNALDLRRL